VTCYYPIEAWRSRERGSSGKQKIIFDGSKAVSLPFKLPCGRCIGCRLERSRQWALRCVHEASLYEDNCYITLTYDDEHLPSDGSLNLKHFQDFMKRLRFKYSDVRIRFFHAGEYGGKHRRPHYHALLFNFDFADKKLFKIVNGLRLYTSDVLAALWQFGFCSVGTLTFQSAAYVARYIMKKVTGDLADEHYVGCNEVTGELVQLVPEYTTMSRGGKDGHGIGYDWFQKFHGDVFPSDEVVLREVTLRPPRYYDCLYETGYPDLFAEVKSQRCFSSKDCTPARLRVREYCKLVQMDRFHRRGDHET